MIVITGYPRLVIAKASTPSASWPHVCPDQFFHALDNSYACAAESAVDSSMLDANDSYPFLIELSLLTGLYEARSGVAFDQQACEQAIQAGAGDLSGPQLRTGFGGRDDAAGCIFGVALKTVVNYETPIQLELDPHNSALSRLEYGNVGNFGLGESILTRSDLYPCHQCEHCQVREPGWRLDSEQSFGYRHAPIYPPSTLAAALAGLEAGDNPFAALLRQISSSAESTLTFYSQLLYRFMPRQQSAFWFDHARNLAEMDGMLNDGDMGWAGEVYAYNPDYDD